MRIVFVSGEADGGRQTASLANALAGRHEVALIEPDEADGLFGELAYANRDHRHSAAVLQAIERACGSDPPDYVEFADRRAAGLVALQARRAGHSLLRDTRIGLRLLGNEELVSLHDGRLERTGGKLLADLEREQLRLADHLIWPGGDSLALYERYYGFPLPPSARIPPPLDLPSGQASISGEEPPLPGGPLRILYCAALQQSRGALDLAEACLRLPRDDWELTMIGRDTSTAPAGQSVRLAIEQMFGEDPRITVGEQSSTAELRASFARHDLLVAPSRFDIWPTAVIEAMAAGLPVLATPVGGLVELVEPGRTGWLCEGFGPKAIGSMLERIVDHPGELESIRASGAPAERARRLSDPGRVAERYEGFLAEQAPSAPRPGSGPRSGPEPLVTGIVPYHRAPDHVEEAVRSLLGQTHRRLEVIVVNDGSFEPEDGVLLRLQEMNRVQVVTQLNGGESSARNLGAALARGDYLMMLDADNVLEPEFVRRAVAALEAMPDLAYVTSWLRFIGPDGTQHRPPAGYAPLGNGVVREDTSNLDGDTLALLPRRLFAELGYSYEVESATHPDWELYRRLRDDGRFGLVIPELLARYRVLPGSLLRTYGEEMIEQGHMEMLNRRNLGRTRWTAEASG